MFWPAGKGHWPVDGSGIKYAFLRVSGIMVKGGFAHQRRCKHE